MEKNLLTAVRSVMPLVRYSCDVPVFRASFSWTSLLLGGSIERAFGEGAAFCHAMAALSSVQQLGGRDFDDQ